MRPETMQLMKAVRAQRENEGCNVHFKGDNGKWDVFSFRTPERAEVFRRKMRRKGYEVL